MNCASEKQWGALETWQIEVHVPETLVPSGNIRYTAAAFCATENLSLKLSDLPVFLKKPKS